MYNIRQIWEGQTIHTKANNNQPSTYFDCECRTVSDGWHFSAQQRSVTEKTAEAVGALGGAIGTNNNQKWSTKNNLIMQNEPNFQKTKMNITSVKTKDYENKQPSGRRKNEPKTNPICKKAKMNTTSVLTGNYDDKQNEPNFKRSHTLKTILFNHL